MHVQSFSPLHILVLVNDKNTLSRLASHLTVEIQFLHPAELLLLCTKHQNVQGGLITMKINYYDSRKQNLVER